MFKHSRTAALHPTWWSVEHDMIVVRYKRHRGISQDTQLTRKRSAEQVSSYSRRVRTCHVHEPNKRHMPKECMRVSWKIWNTSSIWSKYGIKLIPHMSKYNSFSSLNQFLLAVSHVRTYLKIKVVDTGVVVCTLHHRHKSIERGLRCAVWLW